MQINWAAYSFDAYDGYGRYAMHMIRALLGLGVDVRAMILAQLALPGWLQRRTGLDLSLLTITCAPPYMTRGLPCRQWSLSMTEGTILPDGWARTLNDTCERVIVPCAHNREAFVASGVTIPVHVIPGGIAPEEFPLLQRRPGRPYTFLTLADRGARKGWVEVWEAFYRAFGTPADTPDVRLLIKTRPHTNDLVDRIAGAVHRDPRIFFWSENVANPADVYAQADCFAIPSRSEGWGMPHREAATMGLPVITTRYSGLVEGIEGWAAVVLEKLTLQDVPANTPHVRGQWVRADVGELAAGLRWCYEHAEEAAERGRRGAQWLREHQTWQHSARRLLALLEECG